MMIASLMGLLTLVRPRVVAWLPPQTSNMAILASEPSGYRDVLAVEGYRILRTPPPDGSYVTPDPAAWEKALKDQGLKLIDGGEAAPQTKASLDLDAVRRAAKAVKADYYAYVTIDGEGYTGSADVTRVSLNGSLLIDHVLYEKRPETGISVKNHVSVRGHAQPIGAEPLAEKFCVEARRQLGLRLYALAHPKNHTKFPAKTDPKASKSKKGNGWPDTNPNDYPHLPPIHG